MAGSARGASSEGPESRLSTKGQLVVPAGVRARLGLRPGDRIRFLEQDGKVLIEKVVTSPQDDPFGAFSEWASEADDEAFRDL